MSNSSEYVLADDVPGAQTENPDSPTSSRRTDPGVRGTREDRPNTSPDGEPSLEEVLRVVFDVGVGEREAYVTLAGREPSSAGDLADELDRDRSNVNRYLNNLYQKDLVTRRRRILQSGGHVYEYSARPTDDVQELLLAGLERWADTASRRIDQLVAETAETAERLNT